MPIRPTHPAPPRASTAHRRYIFRVTARFDTKGCSVKLVDRDGAPFVSVKPSSYQKRKMKDSIVPGADTIGGVFAVPKTCDPHSMEYKIEWPTEFNGKTVIEKGLWVTFDKLAAAA